MNKIQWDICIIEFHVVEYKLGLIWMSMESILVYHLLCGTAKGAIAIMLCIQYHKRIWLHLIFFGTAVIHSISVTYVHSYFTQNSRVIMLSINQFSATSDKFFENRFTLWLNCFVFSLWFFFLPSSACGRVYRSYALCVCNKIAYSLCFSHRRMSYPKIALRQAATHINSSKRTYRIEHNPKVFPVPFKSM